MEIRQMPHVNSSSQADTDGLTSSAIPLRPLYQLIIFWTLLILGFAAWDSYQFYLSQLTTAKAVARDNFNKDLVYRRWATMHGGVYVPITERTPPNPYLSHIPDRDITAPSGKSLTLMNPAYMTRQVHELAREQYDLRGHITSLKPIRPANVADAWETEALKAFESGASESMSQEMIDGESYIRFMKSMSVEEACLKCHASQGYKNGDVRGGISISVPWAPYRERVLSAIPGKATTFGIVWIVGVIGIVTGRRNLQHYLDERDRAEEEKLAMQQHLQNARKLESLGVLAGGLAHDFNNILATIIGYCGILKFRPEKVADSIPEIEKAAERAAELCRQMLAYAGKTQSVIMQVDMTTLVDEMVRLLKATIPQNTVIKVDLAADATMIQGDSEQLRQIVKNLIINASEAIGEAQGELRISLATTEIREGDPLRDYQGKFIAAGRYACLEVTDTGCGMDDEIRSKIFEPFYTTKFFGRGLGMPATLGIIAAHKGALQLFSQPGQGTTIKVYLPAA